jgi:hypothetical protein
MMPAAARRADTPESRGWSDERTRGYLPRLLREARELEQRAFEARVRLQRASERLRERERAGGGGA